MGGFCGWLGYDVGSELSREFVDQMLRVSPSTQDETTIRACNSKSGIGTYKGIYATSFKELDGIQAVILGSPVWSDNSLAAIATAQSTAQALAEAYRRHGKDLLSLIHGPFALAVSNGNHGLLAIDRIGIRSLSYAVRDGVVAYSTFTTGVAAHPRIGRSIDPQSIFNYFYFHNVPSPGTIYTSVQKLLPAQFIEINDGNLSSGFYWGLHYKDTELADFAHEKTRFFELLRDSIELNSQSGPTATFLSGGTDSSTVTGQLASISDASVSAYSIGFGADGFDEMEYARLAAGHFGAKLREYYLQPEDILQAIPLIAKSYDEPFGNESAVPTYFCAKLAADDGIKFLLAGDGGDEIFGGNARYSKQMVFEHFYRIPEGVRRRLIEPLFLHLPFGENIWPLNKLQSYIKQARIPLPERLETYNFINRHPMHEIFRPEFIAQISSDTPIEMLCDPYLRADSSHPINQMLHLDMKFTLADNDLRKVTRMCEVAGVEVRYPLLDERMVEFSANLPPEYKVRRRKLRWFFKEALKDYLPKEIINKSKHGFGLPFGIWALSHPALSELVDYSLERFASRKYMHAKYIAGLRKLHAEDHPTYFGKMIWLILMLEQWLQTHDQ